MLLFKVRGYCYRINKDKGNESLAVLSFPRHAVKIIFLKDSKEGKLSSKHLGIRNITSDFSHDDTKHCQVQSEHRRIQNPCKHL